MSNDKRLISGDARQELPKLAAGCVDCVITSPPYFGLRDSSTPDQIGSEETVQAWVASLRTVMQEVSRVLVPSGSLWLNLGDAYARRPSDGAPAKSLLLGPERLLVALAADGWLIRNRVAWCKPNPLPSSVSDRLTPSWELLYHVVRQRRYYYDLDVIREPLKQPQVKRRRQVAEDRQSLGRLGNTRGGLMRMKLAGQNGHPLGKNPGDAWAIPGARLRGHRATFPLDLVRRPLLATCPERVCTTCTQPWRRAIHPIRLVDGKPQARQLIRPCQCTGPTRPGMVLDPFMGAGTTAVAAERYRRDWRGIEIDPARAALALARIERARAAAPPTQR